MSYSVVYYSDDAQSTSVRSFDTLDTARAYAYQSADLYHAGDNVEIHDRISCIETVYPKPEIISETASYQW